MNITCKQAVDYISRKEEGKLSPTRRFALWRHLAICSLCRMFSAQNKIITKAMAAEPEAGLTADEKEAMIRSILKDDI